ncbi:MAG TPA: SWF/SNF helicase family protein, partial [Corynebacterium pollutisoli]|nr:SWF/SNF helicase family protein [Corynebacterium pollutisoli]
ERIREIVEEAEEAGRRVLIFTYFLDVLDRLEAELGRRVVGRLSGRVSAATRQTLIDDLGSAPAGSVLLAQITAGGTGLNIQAASVVIIVEPQVKPSIEAQAVARAHRMGQTSTVVVHRLIGDDTVDERMLEMLAGKSRLFDAYARPSESAQVDDAVDVTEGQLAEAIIRAERERLGFDA